MSPDGKIMYDFITETANPEIKDLLVAAIDQCRIIKGKYKIIFSMLFFLKVQIYATL